MKFFYGAFIACAFLIGLSAPATAEPWTIDFDTDTDGVTQFASNTIFGNVDGTLFQRYTDGIPDANAGVKISASGGQNLAVGFDTTLLNTNDPDLQDPFSATGNDLDGPVPDGSNHEYGNVLIVQEVACGGGGPDTCNEADDNIGGSLRFDFDTAVVLLGMHVFDTEEGGGNVQFLDDLGNEVAALAPLPNVGNDGVGFMSFGAQGVLARSMIVTLRGSGAIDNIRGNTVPQVSEPASMALVGVGLAAMGLYRRRRVAAGVTFGRSSAS